MRRLVAVALLVSSLAPAAAQVSSDPRHAKTGVYQLDPRHTQIQFSIMHYGITNFFGRFDKASGTLNFNATDPERSSVSITIDTTSLDTQNAALNKELQEPELFDSARFPEATFKSTAIIRTGANSGKITGDLTIKGITRPVSLDTVFNGSTADIFAPNSILIGFHATTTIKRSDFNITNTVLNSSVADDIKLDVEAPFTIRKE